MLHDKIKEEDVYLFKRKTLKKPELQMHTMVISLPQTRRIPTTLSVYGRPIITTAFIY